MLEFNKNKIMVENKYVDKIRTKSTTQKFKNFQNIRKSLIHTTDDSPIKPLHHTHIGHPLPVQLFQ